MDSTTIISLISTSTVAILTLLFNLIGIIITKNVELKKLKIDFKKIEIENIYKNKYKIFIDLMDNFGKFVSLQNAENKQNLICSISKSIPICVFPVTIKHFKEILKLLIENKNDEAISYFIEKLNSINFNFYQIEDLMKSTNSSSNK